MPDPLRILSLGWEVQSWTLAAMVVHKKEGDLMPLLDYSTQVPAEKTAGQIVSLLARKRAIAIMMEYSPTGSGEIVGLKWKVRTPHGDLPFNLPVNAEAVEKVLMKQYHSRQVPRSATGADQARRVAWRILLEWVRAQMALLDTEMVSLDQLFLPYLVTRHGETLYDHMLMGGFKQLTLPAGNPDG